MKKLFSGHSTENQLLDNQKLLAVFSRILKKIAEIKSVLTFDFPFPLPLKRRLLSKVFDQVAVMKNTIRAHFLSVKDNIRFALFVLFAGFLLAAGMMNRSKSLTPWMDGNQLIDSKPKQSVTPVIHKELSQVSELDKA